jgi:hypothetical protein
MADITITAASVVPSSSAVLEDIIAGATLTRGQPYYLDSADSYTAKPADADTQAAARAVGIVAADLAVGQVGKGIRSDPALAIGATVAAGTAYYVSTTAGGICPVADLGSGDYTTLLGLGISTTQIALAPLVSDVARP